MSNWQAVSAKARQRQQLSDSEALSLAELDSQHDSELLALASSLRDSGFRNVVTYSRKVFIPLTHLCRDVCHYCTFAKSPKRIDSPYMSVDEVLDSVRAAQAMGCKEALLTLGEKPELRYKAARDALAEMGFATTLEYVAHVAKRILEETTLLPHINAGCMTADEIAMLRPVSASMGIMLESASERLTEKGMPHYGSPDKDPQLRLETIRLAGEAAVPFTSGILIGIGETRLERIESLLALRAVHQEHGHLQEIIVQNFRAKADTKMAQAPEPDLAELLWTIAVCRLIFGPHMSIQAPPNLSPGVLEKIVSAGINDWGGVSPLTPDFVNPEAPWPHVEELTRETAVAGKFLQERLTIYPQYAGDVAHWLDTALHTRVLAVVDAEGFPRTDDWISGQHGELPADDLHWLAARPDAGDVSTDVRGILARASTGEALSEQEVVRLFQSRGPDFAAVCRAADELRQKKCGDCVSYVVNRNINYTNICYFKCQFCAFSKGKLSENLRGKPYDLSPEEISRRCLEAWQRGATEVCMQGGIHPEYTGQTYLDILETVKTATPDMHVHAFSPLEVWQGAATLRIPVAEFLHQLKTAGLNTLPGTAAEILDDDIRAIICPDKINSEQWLEVMETAHQHGFRTTATIMFGHVEGLQHWARHILKVRYLQSRTGGFTEFVPLSFVASEAPLYLKGKARRGPTFRESVLMHAVSRLAFNGLIDNIQASWVKLGHSGVEACLNAGVNDVGGTLMNETITRAAGASHGQETSPQEMDALIGAMQRQPLQRTTVYKPVSEERRAAACEAGVLLEVVNTPAKKYERRGERKKLLRNNAENLIASG
ncbi:MAG: FO synthase [Bermanella sp.]|jgi:FO synthase